jgi:hypothetical protein
MPIADCFASIRAKVGVTGVAGVTGNTATHTTLAPVLPLAPKNAKQSQDNIDAVTPATPVTPHNDYDDEYWQEMFEERAAIMEYDGGLPRSEAERLAKQLVDEMRRAKSLR